MPKINFKNVAIRVGGNAAGAVAFAAADKMLPSVDPLYKAIGGLVFGALAPVVAKSKPGSVVEEIGNGLIAASSISLTRKLMPSLVAGPSDVVYVAASPYSNLPYGGMDNTQNPGGPNDISNVA